MAQQPVAQFKVNRVAERQHQMFRVRRGNGHRRRHIGRRQGAHAGGQGLRKPLWRDVKPCDRQIGQWRQNRNQRPADMARAPDPERPLGPGQRLNQPALLQNGAGTGPLRPGAVDHPGHGQRGL